MKAFWKVGILCTLICCGGDPSHRPPPAEFEGIIRYRITMWSDSPVVTVETMQRDMGTTAILHYKNGKCRTSFEGGFLDEVYYDPKENVEYTQRTGSDTLLFGRCDTIFSPLLDVTEESDGPRVAGLACKCLTLTTDRNERRLCYSSELYADPAHFGNYKAAHYDRYYAIARAPFLINEYRSERFGYTYTATSIEPMSLPDSLFIRPNLPIARFPSR